MIKNKNSSQVFDSIFESNNVSEVKDFLENIIALMPGHVYWKNKDGVLLGCNDLQAKSAGLNSRKEIVGKTDYDLPWKNQADSLRKIDEEIISTGVSKTVEEISTLADGKQAVFLSKKVPLFHHDNIIGLLGISFDITAQKEAEALRIEHESLKRQAELMRMLAATIAHELRTPLAAINLAADTTKDYLPELIQGYETAKKQKLLTSEISDEQLQTIASSMDDIEAEANYSNTIINMLLTNLDRQSIKSGELQPCSIAHCVDEALHRYPFQSDERALVHWDNDQDFAFNGKEILTIHVLFNLIKNSLYYIRDAGKGEIKIWIEQGKATNKLYFKDTGKGISADILPSIFNLFFSNTYHGTGIGLAYCKMVMESYKGSIECKSVEGEFTEFVLTFPVRK